jgi:uncharacterized protein (TIGR02996 family)
VADSEEVGERRRGGAKQAALLAAIVAQPEEDTPRLVYADWLQEHGDEEQAQFIRESLQIEWLADYEDEARERMVRRLQASEMSKGRLWLKPFEIVRAELIYDRGMVEGVVYARFDDFCIEADTLFAHVPVRDLTIHNFMSPTHDARDAFLKLAEMPALLALRALRLSNGQFPAFGSWESFITSPHLANLRVLSIQDAGLTDADMGCFEQCEYLTNLEELGLSGNHLTAAGALTLLQSPRLPNLERLGLAYNAIVENRSRGSVYLALRDALIERFDSTSALGSIV